MDCAKFFQFNSFQRGNIIEVGQTVFCWLKLAPLALWLSEAQVHRSHVLSLAALWHHSLLMNGIVMYMYYPHPDISPPGHFPPCSNQVGRTIPPLFLAGLGHFPSCNIIRGGHFPSRLFAYSKELEAKNHFSDTEKDNNSVNRFCPLTIPNHSSPTPICMQSLNKIREKILKLWIGNEVRKADGWTYGQTDTGGYNIIPRHYHVAGYKN